MIQVLKGFLLGIGGTLGYRLTLWVLGYFHL